MNDSSGNNIETSPEDPLLPEYIQEEFRDAFDDRSGSINRFLEQSTQDLTHEMAATRVELAELLEEQEGNPDLERANRIQELKNILLITELELDKRRQIKDDYQQG